MSDELTPREPAAGATLTCAAGITPERLSAWRDGLLPADEAARLAAHAAGCPACGARLSDYDQIGAALRRQRIPQPASDPWLAMQRRLARERRGRRLRTLPAWGGVGALVAAALLVALFAGLLARQAALRPAVGATPTVARTAPPATPSATDTPQAPTAGAWNQIATYGGVLGLTVAPSNPRVAYQIYLDTPKGGPTTLILRRTDDQGATWIDLTPPSGSGAASPNFDGLFLGFVSPLDPRVVYLIIGASTSTSCDSNGVAAGHSCEVEYVSANGGQSWQPLALPTPGLMTAQQININGHAQIAGDIQAQGSRLYSVESSSALGGQNSPAPARLLASDDGGVTWQLIDAPFRAAGQGVYYYSATPSGSTIFVATQPLNQQTGPIAPPPSLLLWRSDDAGASWTNIGHPPNNILMDMRAALDTATHTPILYIETSDSKGQTLIQGSRNGDNGGFTLAPVIPTQGQSYQDHTFLTTLPDGSLVIANVGHIESWNLLSGGTSWRQRAQSVDLLRYTRAFTQSQPDGSTLLWLTGINYSTQVVEYATLPK